MELKRDLDKEYRSSTNIRDPNIIKHSYCDSTWGSNLYNCMYNTKLEQSIWALEPIVLWHYFPSFLQLLKLFWSNIILAKIAEGTN